MTNTQANTQTNSTTETDTTDHQTDGGPDPSPSGQQVSVLARDEGQHIHVLDNLATIKVSPEADGSMSVVEFSANRGFGPPLHCHRDEDELIFVVEGEVVFRSGETEVVATEGTSAYLPHGIPHTFQVLSPTARMLTVTASATTTPQFDRMMVELGIPAPTPTIPSDMEIDPATVALVGAAHGVDILGPPPAPLTD
ncbi:MAG: cupin domain-containing protein [Actinomycetota bacterium]